MSPADLTAQRADMNDPKLTKAAEKAAKKAKREAARKTFWGGLGAALFAVLKSIPWVLIGVLFLGILAAATIFDWFMSGRGWQDLLPGIGIFAFLGAAASVGFWYVGVAMCRKAIKDKDVGEAWLWGIVAVAGYVICIMGVGIATITNTSQAKAQAEQSRSHLQELKIEQADLVSALEVESVDYWTARLAAGERQLKSRLAIAKGTHGMPDLDVDGACAQKLNFNQERQCAYANGGTDPHTGSEVVGVRTEIDQFRNGLKVAEDKADRLETLNTKIETFDLKTGDDTARALGEFLNGEKAGNVAMLIVFVVLSALFLLCGGLFGDGVVRMLIRRL